MPQQPSDDDLLERWRADDKQAGQLLVERYYEGVYRFFSSKVTGDVNDLVQSTFMACVKNRDSYSHKSSFKAWLYGIARNKLYLHFRTKRVSDAHTVLMDPTRFSCVDLGGSPSTLLREKHDGELLQRALPLIPLELQLILELYLWEGFTGRALAEIMKMPENTIRSKVRRAKELLQEEMTKLGSGPAVEHTLKGISAWLEDMQKERDLRFPDLAAASDDDND